MANNVPAQIDYTSRDYEALRNDLVNLVNVRTDAEWTADDPNDLGSVMLESFAYMGDVMSYYIDRVANEMSIDTAARRKTLVDMGQLFGYRVSGPTPATVSVRFENVSDVNVDIPIGTQVLATLLYGNYTEIYFETTESATQLAPGDSVTLLAREGKTVNTDRPDLISSTTNKPLPTSLGTSTGAANQVVPLFDENIVDNSLTVYVGQGDSFASWTFVDTLAEYGSTSLVFTTEVDEYGATSIVFGDGVNGAIPPVNQTISALYKTSAGVSGNIAAETIEEVTFIPGNNIPEAVSYLSVTNPAASYGGTNGDSNTEIRTKVKAAISARRRAVTLNDYEYLALQVPQVGRAKATAAIYSSVTLYLQTLNDGTTKPGIVSGSPTATWNSIKSAVELYMGEKIPAGASLTVVEPTYVDFYISLNIVADSSFKNTAVERAIRSAFINPGGLFAYESVDFGQLLAYSAVMSKAAGVNGVKSVTITKLNTDNSSSASTSGVQLSDGEIAALSTDNLIITVTGGLS